MSTPPALESRFAVMVIREKLRANTALVAALDTTSKGVIKIRKRRPAKNWTIPYAVLDVLSSQAPKRGNGGRKIWANALIQIDILTDETIGDDITDLCISLVDTELENFHGDILGGHVKRCWRNGDRCYDETTNGVTVTHNQVEYWMLVIPSQNYG